MSDGIIRRDFLNGAALVIAAGVAPINMAHAMRAAYNPANNPAGKTGMRGSHDGAFETAHKVRDGEHFPIGGLQVSEVHDLVIVGAGISGLAAAWFYRKHNSHARILILDVHDDFGGHAKRNEFEVSGKLLIGYGGTEALQSPRALYSPVAMGLIKELGIDIDKFNSFFDRNLYHARGLSRALFFKKEAFGVDKLISGSPELGVADDLTADKLNARPLHDFLTDFPLSKAGKAIIKALYTSGKDVMLGKTAAQKSEALKKISYSDFLKTYWNANAEVINCFQNRTCDFFAVGIDGVSAFDAMGTGYPGFDGLKLPTSAESDAEMNEPYIYHFPDGNASVARLLVRKLLPDCAPGNTMEDIVLAPFDYDKLDVHGSLMRIRLRSTVVSARNTGGPVDIGYVRDGKTFRVQARQCIMANYNMMIPYLVPDAPVDQKAILAKNVKGPLVYTNVALKNWQAWDKLKIHMITNPSGFFSLIKLDYPVSMGGYDCAKTPDDPIVLHMVYVPTDANKGLSLAEAYRAGRTKLYNMTFADFETNARDELTRMLGPGGFDANRDIAAITVNRWSHGYAYYPNTLYDDSDQRPWPMDASRRRIGNIAVAGSDAGWDAYTHTAIDQAYRAVSDLMTSPAASSRVKTL
jgi:spermidine dehydrogenase